MALRLLKCLLTTQLTPRLGRSRMWVKMETRFGGIMVVVDHFSKYVTFIPNALDCKVDETARIFFKNMVKLWSIPKSITSSRDPRFTSKF